MLIFSRILLHPQNVLTRSLHWSLFNRFFSKFPAGIQRKSGLCTPSGGCRPYHTESLDARTPHWQRATRSAVKLPAFLSVSCYVLTASPDNLLEFFVHLLVSRLGGLLGGRLLRRRLRLRHLLRCGLFRDLLR